MGKLIQADLRVSPIAGSQFGRLHILCVARVVLPPGTNAQCIIVRYNCVNNRCEEGISNVWYISNSVATGEVCEGGGVVIDP